MFSVKNIITISIICSLCVFSSILAPQAMIHQIDSIDIIEEEVRSLRNAGVRADEICVVLDFHGVITKQKTHQLPLTLKKIRK